MRTTQDNIVTLLCDALKKAWSLDGKQYWFLPIGEVERLITKEAVYQELNKQLGNAGKKDEDFINQLQGADLEELAEKICHDEPLEENPLKYKSFRKTFATLVLAHKPLAIKQFVDGNISDLDLPLAAAGGSSYRESYDLRRRNNISVALSCFDGWLDTEKEDFAKHQWRMTAPWFSRDEFNRVKHFSLYSEQILPFANSPQKRNSRRSHSTEGGTSQVYMIDIHPEHHNFHQEDIGHDGTIRVAIKSIKQQQDADKQLFEIEARALRRFRHKHVVRLLATYEQYDMYYLIFPRADADLVGFWKEVKPDRSHNGMVWLATQCEGMTHALMRLHHATFLDKSSTFPVHTMPNDSTGLVRHHSIASMSATAPRADDEGATGRMGLAADDGSTTPQYRLTRRASTSNCQSVCQEQMSQRCGCYSEQSDTNGPKANDPPAAQKVWGRHGDIKPQNILWYRESKHSSSLGTLKLADFGQAELNSQWSRSKHRRKIAYSITYRPPEFDIPPYITHASYDIWSLGCVYLQCVAWMIGGYNAVFKFAESRRSFDKLMLEDSDVFFNTIISENGKEEAVLKPCIQQAIKKLKGHQNCTAYLNDFLSIIENEMLVVDYQKRGSCVQVRERLLTLLQKGKDEVGYMCRPILDSETTEVQHREIMPGGS
ncbi:hypothetical protein B7494_g1780 [Chlorociboria aeruginascens]|nr:hypothetical protein B7494_g1780 [Chlorociboria aeruginascens]